MKKKNALTVGLSVALLTSGLLAGCGSNGDNTNNSGNANTAANSDTSNSSGNSSNNGSGNAAPEDLFKEHLDISLAYMDIGTVIKDGQSDDMLKMLEEKFNITIKPVNESWGDYGDRTKLWAASGQLPDAFFTDATSGDLFNQWVEQGIIKALPDDMSKYPSLKQYTDLPDVKGAAASDGKLYFIPRMLASRNELPNDRGILIRKDWMDELGLKDPTTYDELKVVLKTIGEKKHVIPLTTSSIDWTSDSVFHNLAPAMQWWQKIDGQWKPGWMTDAFADVVEHERDLYQSGILDKDFSVPNMDASAKFNQGKAAALVNTVKNMAYDVPNWSKENPGVKYIDAVKILPPIPAADGNNYLYGYYDYWSGTMFNGSLSDEKQERILAMFDWLASPEGQKTVRYGLQGTDWEPNGDLVTNKHAEEKDFDLAKKYPSSSILNGMSIWSDGKRYVEGYGPSEAEQTQKYLDEVEAQQLQTGQKAPVNWVVNAYAGSLNTGGGDVQGLVTKLVMGKEDIKEAMKKFADEQMGLGLQDAIDKVNDKFKDEN
ncbi:extracellular solute-binding protein [Paenibacillus sp. OV219]|uniref:extracellular solute-binding protein n=1 Tax=Paenibacillus sp. OV219 TaxID=1884377 RepID=UPI0008D613D3|nr:extracellular solute-binding protein [Paenibacillus sp. OV219]SEO66156.1 putative aldouronate transport system substrate-binding protein [Paenibacillus sp. OV219]